MPILPSWRTINNKVVINAGKIGVTDFCCTCEPWELPVNCLCTQTGSPNELIVGHWPGEGNWNDILNARFEFLDDHSYAFRFTNPFAMIAFLKDGTELMAQEPQCNCITALPPNDCSLLCGSDGLLAAVVGDCFDREQFSCYECQSDGTLPADPGGAVHGDPCTYLATDGSGSRPGGCHQIREWLPVPGHGSPSTTGKCCEIGDIYELERTGSGGAPCFWTMEIRGRCLQVHTPLEPEWFLLKHCVGLLGNGLTVWVNRGWHEWPLSPFTFYLYAAITNPASVDQDPLSWYKHQTVYRSAPLKVRETEDETYNNICAVLAQGWHTMNKIGIAYDATHGGNPTNRPLSCNHPDSFTILAHGNPPSLV